MADAKRAALCIEGHGPMRELLGIYLRHAGYVSTTTGNYEDALTSARMQRYDLYVLSGEFPVRNGSDENETGLNLYDEIKGIHDEARCIIFSSSDALQSECDARGIAYIPRSDIDRIKEILEI